MCLNKIDISAFTPSAGQKLPVPDLTYEIFGPDLGKAPVVLVVHALTGNSTVSGPKGWWNEIIGSGKVIDTDFFTVFAPNIPGNGYSGSDYLIENYSDLHTGDIARLFHFALQKVGVTEVYAAIGGSIGGGIVWELAAAYPNFINHLIPIATDWKATDWLLAQTFIQDRLLRHSAQPLEDARIHAMTLYRTPQSFKAKFNRSVHPDKGIFNIHSWLIHHGEKLRSRFTVSAYKTLNHLLSSVNICRQGSSFEEVVLPIASEIHLIAVDSDLFFIPEENRRTHTCLLKLGKKAHFHLIHSPHGHDAFLIEFGQLTPILKTVFTSQNTVAEKQNV